jgi:hypothetical protein
MIAVAFTASALTAQPRSPVIQDRVRLDPSDPVGFRVLITPDTVFVGQQATYEIGVFISESAQQRMRRNPEVVPAELRGVLAYDLGGPQSLPAITQNGVRSFPHVLQRALFPLAPGRLEIPASQLTYTLPRSASFFSREESAVMRADDVMLHVKPLPLNGQPAGFSGAVGDLELRASVDASDARVGEPVVLTVRVRGRGNVKLWPRPDVSTPGAVLVPAGERVIADTTGQFVRGTKEFDWLVTPEREGPLAVPVITYAYFDPYEAAYRVASTDSIGIVIAAGEFVAAPQGVVERDGIALRTVDRGETRLPLSRHPLLWALLALAPLPALLRTRPVASTEASADTRDRTAATVARRETPATASERARRTAADARRQLLDTLAVQLAASASSLSAHAALERRLRRRGVTRRTAEQVVALVAELDAAAWARDPGDVSRHDGDVRARTEALLAQVTLEAMPVLPHAATEGPRGTNATIASVVVLCAALAGVGTLHARAVQPASFEAAVATFDQRRYPDAAAQFLAVVAEQPRHADAWANAGSAAWASNDSVTAVRAWQRALRLEPTAVDVRRHLTLLSSASWDGVARVPDVHVDVGTLLAALCWCLGWGAIAWARRRNAVGRDTTAAPRVLPAVGGALLLMAVTAGVWQMWLERRLAHERLAVIARAEPMHVAPGRDANVFGGTTRGDVVRLDASRVDGAVGETWAGVTHADGRSGWLPASALVPLE